MPRRTWILRHERTLTLAIAGAAVVAVLVAAAVHYDIGIGGGSGGHTTTTLGLGERLGANAETQSPAFPKGTLHPGALNPDVTQANIQRTICSDVWLRSVTPDATFLVRLERKQLADENKPGTTADYEEDHLVPVELGGAPKDAKNLWPEPYESRGARYATKGNGAESKDAVEEKLRGKVCTGRLTLKLARQAIAGNWQLAGAQL